MFLEFSLNFSEFITIYLKHLCSNLVNRCRYYQIWNSAMRGSCVHIQKHGNFHQRLPKSQNPSVISDPAVWIAITPKKGAYSSSTDLISVRLDQGVVHDLTTPNKWSIIGTNLYKVSGTLHNDFSSSC